MHQRFQKFSLLAPPFLHNASSHVAPHSQSARYATYFREVANGQLNEFHLPKISSRNVEKESFKGQLCSSSRPRAVHSNYVEGISVAEATLLSHRTHDLISNEHSFHFVLKTVDEVDAF